METCNSAKKKKRKRSKSVVIETGVRENHLLVNKLPTDFHAAGWGHIYYVMLGPIPFHYHFCRNIIACSTCYIFKFTF